MQSPLMQCIHYPWQCLTYVRACPSRSRWGGAARRGSAITRSSSERNRSTRGEINRECHINGVLALSSTRSSSSLPYTVALMKKKGIAIVYLTSTCVPFQMPKSDSVESPQHFLLDPPPLGKKEATNGEQQMEGKSKKNHNGPLFKEKNFISLEAFFPHRLINVLLLHFIVRVKERVYQMRLR